jgi:ABC-type multidrug transport system ATPase subunit
MKLLVSTLSLHATFLNSEKVYRGAERAENYIIRLLKMVKSPYIGNATVKTFNKGHVKKISVVAVMGKRGVKLLVSFL